MYHPYLNEQIAAQYAAELRGQASSRHARQVLGVRSRRVSLRPERYRRSHPMRRRAGYALISIGLRLAYAAGDD